jgi:hypothetical protein
MTMDWNQIQRTAAELNEYAAIMVSETLLRYDPKDVRVSLRIIRTKLAAINELLHDGEKQAANGGVS